MSTELSVWVEHLWARLLRLAGRELPHELLARDHSLLDVDRRLFVVTQGRAGVAAPSTTPVASLPSPALQTADAPIGTTPHQQASAQGSTQRRAAPSTADNTPAATYRFDPGRRGVRALAVVVVLVAAVAGGITWWKRPSATPVEVRPVAVEEPSAAATVVVAITGAVHRPGLVHVPAGARVADVLEAAGGVLPDTDLGQLNLARKVADGELVIVGAAAAGGDETQPGKVNLNSATVAELDALPGVGPVTAQRIVDYRTSRGPFRDVGELRHVEGIGNAKFEQLKELVTV